jgi:predicted small secreted protein
LVRQTFQETQVMRATLHPIAAAALAAALLTGCKSGGVGDAVESAGSAVAKGASSVASGIPSLVNVDLKDVLNDLSVRLNLDRANIPINAQIPISLAANVCGVSINILSISTGGQANCTAKTASPELAQVVQQQIAAGGSVGGGAQGGSTAGTSGTTATGGTSTSGATDTGAQSSGSAPGTAPLPDVNVPTTQPQTQPPPDQPDN